MNDFSYRAKDYQGEYVYGKAYYLTDKNYNDNIIDALQVSFDEIVAVVPSTVQLKSPFIDLVGDIIYTGDCVNVQKIGDSHYGWHVEYSTWEGKFIVFNGLNSNRDIENSMEHHINDDGICEPIACVEVTPDNNWFCQLGLNDEKLIINKEPYVFNK